MRFLLLLLLLLPLPASAAMSAMDMALKLVNTDAAAANFEEYAARYTQTLNDTTDKMIAAAQTDDLKHAFETQLPKVAELKVGLLRSMQNDMPGIYAQIFTENFSSDELLLMMNASRSIDDREAYDRSGVADKAALILPKLDALAQQRLVDNFRDKLNDKAFVAEMAKVSDRGVLDLTEAMQRAEKAAPVKAVARP